MHSGDPPGQCEIKNSKKLRKQNETNIDHSDNAVITCFGRL
jgi:hypothetical protein